MTYDATLQLYLYPCPCGDQFQISIDDLRDGEEIAVCPSCSLQIRVIFDLEDLPKPEAEAEEVKDTAAEEEEQATSERPQQAIVAAAA